MTEKFYITTAIPYVNAKPHIGFAFELAEADAIARFRRLRGDRVHFLTGTSEHGAKVMRAAQEAKKPVREFVNEHAEEFRALLGRMNISNDDFIRNSDEKRHMPGAQELWKRLDAAGDIYKKMYRGLYCVGHEAFVTEKDLKDGICIDHGKAPETIEEENYFFRLSKYRDPILKAIESGTLAIYPETRKNEAVSFLKEGLEDVSFSRPAKDIPWGVSVPGDATQMMYVWCDELTNYITALGFGSENISKFKEFWPADLHVIGKDILRFHAVIWPGMLLSAGLPFPKALFVHGHIFSGGKKMSKTVGNVIDPILMIERYGADALRYFLLREIPTFDDGDFTEERFLEAYNAALANGIGNYVSRVVKMIENDCSGILEKPSLDDLARVPIKKQSSFFAMEGSEGSKVETVSLAYFFDKVVWPAYDRAMERYELKRAMDIIWEALGELDGYVDFYEPFRLIKAEPEKAKAVLWNLAEGALSMAWLLKPFMPDTADAILHAFGTKSDDQGEWKKVSVKLAAPLFPRKE
ncbi:MAG: methionine--tRNA ligase [Candidatus Niyogibacteria bacterium]|nr:methionine--tRNA ligase [Candidatus Niyogibacteria bacterium]